eukprot:COSAG01_NODE_461_length_16698_cov_113.458160_6_plen_104_part_00
MIYIIIYLYYIYELLDRDYLNNSKECQDTVIDPTTFLSTSDFPHIFPCFTPLIRFRIFGLGDCYILSNEAALLTLNAVPVCSHPLHSKITCWTVALSLPQHGH